MAVDEINHNGGIRGRKLLLISGDDENNPETARKVDKELIDKGVVAIIGHPTSQMSLASVPMINEHKILMISPSTSSDALTGIDDYFIRVIPDNRAIAYKHALYTYNNLKAENVACAIDLSNESFTMTYFSNFKHKFEEISGSAVHAVKFTSGPDVAYRNLVSELLSFNPDNILIITNPMDAAMICQYLAKQHYKKSTTSQGWALADEFITHSGKTSEGVIFPIYTYPTSAEKAYLSFKATYNKIYKGEPQWGEIFTYEAVMMLRDALMKAESYMPDEIRKHILEQTFHGLQGDFSINRYGDGKREIFWIKVVNFQFRRIDE